MSGELHICSTSALFRALSWHKSPQRCANLLIGVETYLGAERGSWRTIQEISDWVWPADGGSEWNKQAIEAAIMRLRRRGVPIEAQCTRGYRIAAFPEPKEGGHG